MKTENQRNLRIPYHSIMSSISKQGSPMKPREEVPIHRSISLSLPSVPTIEKVSCSLHEMKKYSHEKIPVDNIWDVQSIPTLPMYYPLEKTHIIVCDEPVSEVTKRISDRMRSLSIAAAYDSTKVGDIF